MGQENLRSRRENATGQGWARKTSDNKRYETFIRGVDRHSIPFSVRIVGEQDLVQRTMRTMMMLAGISHREMEDLYKGQISKEQRERKWQKNCLDGQMKFPES